MSNTPWTSHNAHGHVLFRNFTTSFSLSVNLFKMKKIIVNLFSGGGLLKRITIVSFLAFVNLLKKEILFVSCWQKRGLDGCRSFQHSPLLTGWWVLLEFAGTTTKQLSALFEPCVAVNPTKQMCLQHRSQMTMVKVDILAECPPPPRFTCVLSVKCLRLSDL